ncbi:MAG: hypothetical protein Q8P18_17780 [Pseudomonadota bacterium]|nr:hypothetical protein [Pseudomonadota bacterium]
MSGVDDVFSPESPRPAPPPDRLRRISRLLALALPLNLFGIFCFTGVPGAVMALVGWQLADEEVARAESGALPREARPRAERLRAFAFTQMTLALLSLVAQVVLFGLGFYDYLLQFFLGLAGIGAPAA